MNFKYLAIASIEQKQACRDWDFLNISLFVSNERFCGFNAIFSSGYIERYSSITVGIIPSATGPYTTEY